MPNENVATREYNPVLFNASPKSRIMQKVVSRLVFNGEGWLRKMETEESREEYKEMEVAKVKQNDA